CHTILCMITFIFFFFHDTPTPDIYTLSLHDALPIFEIVRTLAVLRVFVVAAAPGKVSGGGMIRPWESAIADAIPIDVLVAGEPAQPVEIFLAQHLAALDRSLGIFEGV